VHGTPEKEIRHMSATKNTTKKQRKDRNEQRHARALAAERGITYHDALQELRSTSVQTKAAPAEESPLYTADDQPNITALGGAFVKKLTQLEDEDPSSAAIFKQKWDAKLDGPGGIISVSEQMIDELDALLANAPQENYYGRVRNGRRIITKQELREDLDENPKEALQRTLTEKLAKLGAQDPSSALLWEQKWVTELGGIGNLVFGPKQMMVELDELLANAQDGDTVEDKRRIAWQEEFKKMLHMPQGAASELGKLTESQRNLRDLVTSDVKMKVFAVHYAEAHTKAQKEALAKEYGITMTACYNTGVQAVARFLGNDAYAELSGSPEATPNSSDKPSVCKVVEEIAANRIHSFNASWVAGRTCLPLEDVQPALEALVNHGQLDVTHELICPRTGFALDHFAATDPLPLGKTIATFKEGRGDDGSFVVDESDILTKYSPSAKLLSRIPDRNATGVSAD